MVIHCKCLSSYCIIVQQVISEIRQAPNESVSDSVIMTCSINLSGGDCAESLRQLWNVHRVTSKWLHSPHIIGLHLSYLCLDYLFPSSFCCVCCFADFEAVNITEWLCDVCVSLIAYRSMLCSHAYCCEGEWAIPHLWRADLALRAFIARRNWKDHPG